MCLLENLKLHLRLALYFSWRAVNPTHIPNCYSTILCGNLMGISYLVCLKSNSGISLRICLFCSLSHLSKWQLVPSSCMGQNFEFIFDFFFHISHLFSYIIKLFITLTQPLHCFLYFYLNSCYHHLLAVLLQLSLFKIETRVTFLKSRSMSLLGSQSSNDVPSPLEWKFKSRPATSPNLSLPALPLIHLTPTMGLQAGLRLVQWAPTGPLYLTICLPRMPSF